MWSLCKANAWLWVGLVWVFMSATWLWSVFEWFVIKVVFVCVVVFQAVFKIDDAVRGPSVHVNWGLFFAKQYFWRDFWRDKYSCDSLAYCTITADTQFEVNWNQEIHLELVQLRKCNSSNFTVLAVFHHSRILRALECDEIGCREESEYRVLRHLAEAPSFNTIDVKKGNSEVDRWYRYSRIVYHTLYVVS